MSPPIFVFGSPRSGTSLVSQILNAHPEIGVPYETLIYSTFWPIRRHYGDLSEQENLTRLISHVLSWKPVADFAPPIKIANVLRLVSSPSFHGVFEAVIRAWLETQDKARWGEKSPWHAFYWRELLEGFPDAKVVHVIRDVRDATLSWKLARQGPRNAAVLARRWAQYQDHMRQVERGWPAENFHEIRYEHLLQNPEAETRKLCHFLHEPFSRDMLKFHEKMGTYTTDSTNRENLTKPILSGNSGKWRTGLSDLELRFVETVASAQMRDRGYTPSLNPTTVTRVEQVVNDYLRNPASRMRGMLEDRQGQYEGIQKLWFPLAARLGIPRSSQTPRSA